MPKLKRLIILDLNGLLIQRLYKNDYASTKHLFTEPVSQGTISAAERKGNFAVWFRPHVKDFIVWLMDHFHVAIWSSVLQHNISPIVESLLPEEQTRDRLLFWWNQEHCLVEDDPNATDPKKSKSFYKCLSTVWDDVEITERWALNQSKTSLNLRDHTLLIDDNKAKVRDNPPFTAIHPRTWKLFELYDDNHQLRLYKDDILDVHGHLREWLKGLLEWNGTVAEYVQQNPYVDPPLEEIVKVQSSSWESSGWD